MNYVPVRSNARLLAAFGIGLPSEDWRPELWPRYQGPIVRRDAECIDLGLESIAATWGLLPWWAKAPKIAWSTVNARAEEVESKASYRDAWKRGQRCVIPMESFFEPNWESGQHVRWRFWRGDGAPMGIAGLWERWRPKEQDGEELITFTALTVNADDHPLMRRMHKPGEEKRMMAILSEEQYAPWLGAPLQEARRLLSTYPAEALDAEPAPLPTKAAQQTGLNGEASLDL
ncbi:SOS response-associated peptidase [Eleftheria terrae]|uniref:SOS response-associated peptidase n=1 Tax=Eleftheria terrae TaxID=1597781 RepID=UPI00263A71A6|nr:SOS response-associated peptidase [Eleftheria terrae]WKB50840.1 SOS response-associated peptidase [Eleftheria terrae]